jgi:hypothetical protein
MSALLAQKYPSSEAFGMTLGKGNRISVLDIDTQDTNVLHEALERFGPTPFVVKTGSGHYQAWYRHQGEGRHIRPFPGQPIDILGHGFVVAPPSRTGQGYELISGSLQDLRTLPYMRQSERFRSENPDQHSAVGEGSRNKTLFRFALRQARYVDDEVTLLDAVQTENENACFPPLDGNEVARVVRSAWRYQIEGRNFVGSKHVSAVSNEINTLANSAPDAFALLMILRSNHQNRAEFALGKAMAAKLGWTIPRFKKARTKLETVGKIRRLHPGGKGPNDPPLYSFG